MILLYSIRTARAVRRRWDHAVLRALCVALMVFAASPAAAQDSAVANGKALTTGVYTDGQAQRGENTYKQNCVSCHSAKEYTGAAFRVAWVSRSVFDIFDRIKTLMPDDNPGILPRKDYIDIVAYLFSLNGYPSGAEELPDDDDALKKITIDSLPGGARDAHDLWSALLVRRQLASHRGAAPYARRVIP